MFLSSSASACVGSESEKKYDSSSKEMMNPEFLEHCRRLLLSSLLPEHPSFGYFTELKNTIACQCCQKESYFVRMVEKQKKKEKEKEKEKDVPSESDEVEISFESRCTLSQECYCFVCYIDRFCNVNTFQNRDGSETYYIFKEKGSRGRILYQSSSVMQRLVGSSSD